MNECEPSLTQQLLSGELSDAAAAEFEAHLETCPACRQRLEQQAGDQESWETFRQMLGSSAELVCGPPTPVRLPPTEFHATIRDDWEHATASVDLSILGPTDEPDSLGRIGNYEVLGVIGRGGMGIVFKAVDAPLNRNVAVKVLDPALAGIGAARQRFAREARAMAAISHEHLVPIYAVDEHRGLPFFAMEYVAGGTLESRLRHQGPLDVISILRIAYQVASALAAAHESGLVHRDIKPANILLDRGIERVRVADFGLARIANDASDTRSGIVAGTPQFMAPEQVRGEACDASSDLFSLGSVLYAMCTGHPPFRAETVYGVMQRIVHDPPRSIRQQNPIIPEWLEALVARLHQKDRQLRFGSAADVARLLEAELSHLQNPAGQGVPPRDWMRPQVPRPPRSRRRQKRLTVAGILMGLALLTVSMIWIQWPGGSEVAPNKPAPPLTYSQESDAFRDAMRWAAMLEAATFRSAPADMDPWYSETQQMRQQMADWEEEEGEGIIAEATRDKP